MSITAQNGPDHLQESMQLEAKGYVELFQIQLSDPDTGAIQYLFFTSKQAVNWQGKKWEGFPLALVGYGQQTSGEQTRPKLTVVNPAGVFSRYVHQGWTDNALVTRFRVLKSHLDQNINSFVKNVWRVSKPLAAGVSSVSLELRGAADGQNFFLPGRAFFPPEFPHVSL